MCWEQTKLTEAFCFGKTCMELDIEKPIFKDFFFLLLLTLMVIISFFCLLFKIIFGAKVNPLGAADFIVRSLGLCTATLCSPAWRLQGSLKTPLPGLRYWSLYLRTQEQISLVFKLLELANTPLLPREFTNNGSFHCSLWPNLLLFFICKLVFIEYAIV